MAGELLAKTIGATFQHVPYRGSGPALVGLLGGEITVMFENLPSALSHARGGKLHGIAVLSRKRSPSAPEFPTTFELGMPDLVIASSTGLLAPKGTPREVVAILERTVRAIASDPEMVRTFGGFGADMDFLDAVQYQHYIDDEIKRWTVNRSTFVHKNAREQFEMRIHKRLIDILNPSPKVIEALTNLNLPTGVTIDVKMV